MVPWEVSPCIVRFAGAADLVDRASYYEDNLGVYKAPPAAALKLID